MRAKLILRMFAFLGSLFGSTAMAGPTLATLATFTSTNGANPYGGLVADASGNLYGTAENGGANGDGTVYEIGSGTHTLSTLATFTDVVNGESPRASLIADASGNLYGTTSASGPAGYGTVFEVAAATHTISVLVPFNYTDGDAPYAGLVADTSGNLYGTTSGGGSSNGGIVFKVATGTRTLNTLAAFSGSNGWESFAGLLRDASGNLYGTTVYGGPTYIPIKGVMDSVRCSRWWPVRKSSTHSSHSTILMAKIRVVA